jgi:hypothetical protein
MSALLRFASLRRLHWVLGLMVIAFGVLPSASGAAELDTAAATGSSSNYTHINIKAQSGTSGQNPSGTASFTALNAFPISGPVTCLSVYGPDHGAGMSGAPTDAVMNVQDQAFGVVTVELVDHGGNGSDTISTAPSLRAPRDCSPYNNGGLTDTLSSGRTVVVDAPVAQQTGWYFVRGAGSLFGVSFGLSVRSNEDFGKVRGYTEVTGVGVLNFDAEATCLNVVGNQATIGYRIDRGHNEGQGFLGAFQDNGDPVSGSPVDYVLWSEFVPTAPTTCPPPTPAPSGSGSGGVFSSGNITIGRLHGHEN